LPISPPIRQEDKPKPAETKTLQWYPENTAQVRDSLRPDETVSGATSKGAVRNAQQAVVEVEELLFRGHTDVVDADLADYFGSIPHTDSYPFGQSRERE
jgi:hypothetical protein